MKNPALLYEVPAQPKGWSRYSSIAVVATLHIAAIWALALGLGVKIGISGPQIFPTQIIQPHTKPPPTTPLPNPTFKPVTPATMPEPYIKIDSDGGGTGIQTNPSPTQPQTSTAPDSPPVAIGPTHGAPPYPPLARRLGEQGNVILSLTIGTDGAVTDVQIANSSGSTELDQAAMEWVKAHWRYKPAIHNGVAVASTAKVGVRFDLKDAQ
jgi:periplasmic protein TonB